MHYMYSSLQVDLSTHPCYMLVGRNLQFHFHAVNSSIHVFHNEHQFPYTNLSKGSVKSISSSTCFLAFNKSPSNNRPPSAKISQISSFKERYGISPWKMYNRTVLGFTTNIEIYNRLLSPTHADPHVSRNLIGHICLHNSPQTWQHPHCSK